MKNKRFDILISIEDRKDGNKGIIQIDGQPNAVMIALAIVHLQKAIRVLAKRFDEVGEPSSKSSNWRNYGKEDN